MNTNNNFQLFSSKINFVTLADGQKVQVLEFIGKSYKRYRYNNYENVIERQCYKCQQWFKVLRYQDGEWLYIHDESDYHFSGGKSGFGSYCTSCSKPKTSDKKQISNLEKYSLFLTKENLRYISIRCAAQDISKTNLINELLDQERLKNPLSKFI